MRYANWMCILMEVKFIVNLYKVHHYPEVAEIKLTHETKLDKFVHFIMYAIISEMPRLRP
jgi:hypothetical protein